MITVSYLLVGVVLACVVAGYFWPKVSADSHSRLVALAAIVAVAWPGAAILALADRKRTVIDYLSQWLGISGDNGE
jgi:hypothetical protein